MRLTTYALLLTGIASAQAAGAQARPDAVLGAQVRVQLGEHAGATGPMARFEGELIAATADSLWLLSGGTLRPFSSAAVAAVRVDRGKYGVGYAVKRGAVFGLITGVALTLACASVDDNGGSCILVVPLSVGLASGVGVIAGVFLRADRYTTIRAPSLNGLNAWARFPQGLPPEFRLPPVSGHPPMPLQGPAGSPPRDTLPRVPTP